MAAAYCSAVASPSGAAANDRAALTKKTETMGPRLQKTARDFIAALSITTTKLQCSIKTPRLLHLPPTVSRNTAAMALNDSDGDGGREGARAIRASHARVTWMEPGAS
jgi:hypothetical protein